MARVAASTVANPANDADELTLGWREAISSGAGGDQNNIVRRG